jgi:hypothetical protein
LLVSGFRPIYCGIAPPIQVPVWHKYVGAYYQYPSPWVLDWKRHLGRVIFFRLAQLEYVISKKRVGWFAPNIVVVAEKESGS